MASKPVPQDTLISDTTVLINFLETERFDLLITLYGGRLHITDVVDAEVKGLRQALELAKEKGEIKVHPVPREKIATLSAAHENLHVGEASCIELAQSLELRIASDDGAAKMVIQKVLGVQYWLSTFDILLEANSKGHITKDAAIALVEEMKTKASFWFSPMRFEKFKGQLS